MLGVGSDFDLADLSHWGLGPRAHALIRRTTQSPIRRIPPLSASYSWPEATAHRSAIAKSPSKPPEHVPAS